MANAPPLRILVAEDNLLNQKLAIQMLKHLGYEAQVASNGLEVLERLRQAVFDVVLMDVQMPKMDGLTAAREITQQWPPAQRPHMIAMTGGTLDGDRDACYAAGMQSYISKPVSLEKLRAILQNCVPLADPEPEDSQADNQADNQSDTQLDNQLDSQLDNQTAADLPPAEPPLPILDFQALNAIRDSAGASAEAFLLEIIDCFFNDTPDLLNAILDALDRQDSTDLANTSHTLKGMSISIGASRLADLFARIETWTQEPQFWTHPPIPLTRILPTIEAEYSQVQTLLLQVRSQAIHSLKTSA